MGIGLSIFLIAVGAVLAFAVHLTASGIDLNTIGLILMVVGVIGLATSLLLLNGGGFGSWYDGPRRRTVVDDRVVQDRVVEDRVVEVEPPPVQVSRVAPVVRRRVIRRRDVI